MYENLSIRLLESVLMQKSYDQVFNHQDNRKVIRLLEDLICKKSNNRPEESVTQGGY